MVKISTRNKIKIAAQSLFAERGMSGVSVREIVAAAGQKNMASLHYYFRTKEELARELLLDAAAVIEERRIRLLDAAETAGGPTSLLQVLEIFIKSAVLPEDDPRALSNVRLYLHAFQHDAEFVQSTVSETGDVGYFRCLGHIKTFLAPLPADVMKRRMYLMQHYVFNLLGARERAISTGSVEAPFWQGEAMLNELITGAERFLSGGDCE